MYNRLRSMLAYHQVTIRTLSEHLDLNHNTVGRKINGRAEWSFGEVVEVVKFFKKIGADYSIEEVFEEIFK